ncbi:MAG: hypothetical protein IJY15_08405 [Thermoguttaceae bacterium]|nr:hypothetical protein [Thermoguttaceae bacterium]
MPKALSKRRETRPTLPLAFALATVGALAAPSVSIFADEPAKETIAAQAPDAAASKPESSNVQGAPSAEPRVFVESLVLQ